MARLLRPKQPLWDGRDRFILSKGHGCLTLYALLADLGFFDAGELPPVDPFAVAVMAELGIDLSREACRFMTVHEGRVADVPCRLLRVSFTGELSYELYVPADAGLALWERLPECRCGPTCSDMGQSARPWVAPA